MNFLLEIGKTDLNKVIIETEGFWETFIFGGKIVLIGMATIFTVLCLIWFALSLFKVFFHDLKMKKKPTVVKVEEQSEVQNTAPVQADDSEIVAVIAAAIAMAESEHSGVKFKVVSFNRK